MINRWQLLYPEEPPEENEGGRPAGDPSAPASQGPDQSGSTDAPADAPEKPERRGPAPGAVEPPPEDGPPMGPSSREVPPRPPPPAPASPGFTLAGSRYKLGRGPDFYGVWPRTGPRNRPMWVFPLTEAGWEMAWRRFCREEPRSAPTLGQLTARLRRNR
jgi:hypothetical protein